MIGQTDTEDCFGPVLSACVAFTVNETEVLSEQSEPEKQTFNALVSDLKPEKLFSKFSATTH